jgi:DNA-binding NarL/FixJ family response regulator
VEILIVDSSMQIIIRLEEILLISVNITAFYRADSYEKAILFFKVNNPGVVLLDIGMPRNESFKLLKEIRQTGSKTCIIVLSIHIDKDIQEQCKLLGADFFLDKYHEFEKIPGIIDTITNSESK